jgi:hypothetical protein
LNRRRSRMCLFEPPKLGLLVYEKSYDMEYLSHAKGFYTIIFSRTL